VVWSSLPESQMRPVLMIVADIFGEQSLQMVFVRSDDVIQQITAATPDPAFRDTVLPKAFERRAHRLDLQRPNGCGNLDSVLAIPVED